MKTTARAEVPNCHGDDEQVGPPVKWAGDPSRSMTGTTPKAPMRRKERLRRDRVSVEQHAQIEPARESRQNERRDCERIPVKQRRSDICAASAVSVVTVVPSGVWSMVEPTTALQTMPSRRVLEQAPDHVAPMMIERSFAGGWSFSGDPCRCV
jgi:hypothetical protein